jgi:DNA-binding NtrC family response regulator
LVLGKPTRPPGSEAHPFFAASLGDDGRPPTLAELEKQYVERLLNHARWNRAEVARLLKVSYPTVMKKIADYGIKVPR